MSNKRYWQLYLCISAGVIAASFYPIYMGIKVVGEMLRSGAVPVESYPKYVIPYTPIAIALILGVLLIPVFQTLSRRMDFLWGAIFSTGIFFAAERLMETKIIVRGDELVLLEGWQMSLCYVPPEAYRTRTWQAVDVLLGGYHPAFKLHFYIISIVLIISILNCFYGFAKMLYTGNHTRKKALTIQSVTSLAFLGMCIWACFTSFYRTGEITVSFPSAVLMAVFFALLGITTGVFVSSLTIGKAWKMSILLPVIIAAVTTLAMYIGEMILLSGNLYRFGTGFLFETLGPLVLAPVDLLLIFISGGATGLICKTISQSSPAKSKKGTK